MRLLKGYSKLTGTGQQGTVTLLMSMILLIATTLLAFVGAKTALMEHRISGNEYRSMEVYQAAEAGLEYALIWLGTPGNSVSWTAGSNPACSGSFNENGMTAGPDITAANGDTYALSLAFCRNTATANHVIQVAATATANQDSSISKTVKIYTRADLGPVNPGFSAAPLVFGGCMNNVNGTPDVWPTSGVAIEAKDGNLGCINTGFLGLNGGIVDDPIPATQDMWDYVFSKSRAEIKALADAEVAAGITDAQRKYVWVDDSSPFHRSIGSTSNYAVVVFSSLANCPKINGNPTIYGVVFVDSDCPSANGFGGADFHGSVVVDGTIEKLNANVNFRESSGVTDLTGQQFPNGFAPREIGTWSDF